MAVDIPAMTQTARMIVAGDTGYSQPRRWTFYNRATDTFIPHQETDCSAMCGVIARAGTKKVVLTAGHADMWTGSIEAILTATGDFVGMPYPGAGQVREGDFLLKPGHVAYAVSPTLVAEALSDEYGGAAGGRPGNQTGRETIIRGNYGGWTRLIRPIQKAGVFMALTDDEQKELLEGVREVKRRTTDFNDYMTEGGPKGGVPTIFKRIYAAVTDRNGVGVGIRGQNNQDLITGGGPYGQKHSLLREIIANQQMILVRLDALEAKHA